MFKQLSEEALDSFFDKADPDFVVNIEQMHAMYKLPVTDQPSLHNLTKPNGLSEAASARIKGFLRTLADEVDEGNEIQQFLEMLESNERDALTDAEQVALADPAVDPTRKKFLQFKNLLAHQDIKGAEEVVLTMIADWLADIVVYVRSEAMKFGIPLEMVQQLVMASNFTKLPADGVLKHDENGKFLKDMSSYQPPEDAIYSVIFDPELYDVEDEDDEDEDEDN